MERGCGGRAEIQGMGDQATLCCLAPGAREPVGVWEGAGRWAGAGAECQERLSRAGAAGGGGRWVQDGGRAGEVVLEHSGFQSHPGALQLGFPEAFLKLQFPCQNSEVQASGRFEPAGLCS